jgi:hypothetical protein
LNLERKYLVVEEAVSLQTRHDWEVYTHLAARVGLVLTTQKETGLSLVFIEIRQRKLDHIWLPLGLFPRCVVRSCARKAAIHQVRASTTFIVARRVPVSMRRGFFPSQIAFVLLPFHRVRAASSVS